MIPRLTDAGPSPEPIRGRKRVLPGWELRYAAKDSDPPLSVSVSLSAAIAHELGRKQPNASPSTGKAIRIPIIGKTVIPKTIRISPTTVRAVPMTMDANLSAILTDVFIAISLRFILQILVS